MINRRTLRRWLQTWAIVDIFVCGGAIAATLAYVRYRAAHSITPNGWVDLWPNFTVEVIGAWLSVRVIDYLIRRRGDKSQARWRQADILMHWRDLGDRIGRYAEARDTHLLADELRFHEEPHNSLRRVKYLNTSEQGKVEDAREAAHSLISEYANYARANEAYKACEYEDPKKDELDAERKRLQTTLQQKATALADVALRARTDILAEEFELE